MQNVSCSFASELVLSRYEFSLAIKSWRWEGQLTENPLTITTNQSKRPALKAYVVYRITCSYGKVYIGETQSSRHENQRALLGMRLL